MNSNIDSKRSRGILIAYNKGYRIKNGVILNAKNNPLKGCVDKLGYRYFMVKYKTVNYKVSVHRLAAYQEFGDKIFGEGLVVRHLDDDKENNNQENIVLGTQSDNAYDRPKNERLEHGRHANSFLKKFNHDEVKSFYFKTKVTS